MAALTGLAYAGVLVGVRRPAARLLPALLLPGLALGMNHPAPDGFAVAAVMLAGSVWATLVTWSWPRPHPPAVPAARERAPDGPVARRATHSYAVLFAAAAGTGLALGYLLGLAHVAWASAAAMFIMRPDPGLLASRAVGRTVATFAGVVAAGLLLRRGPAELALAAAAVAAMVAVRTSRWYVTSAGSGLIVLLISGVEHPRPFAVSFADRLLETALGAGLALLFGVAVPAGLRRARAAAPRPGRPGSSHRQGSAGSGRRSGSAASASGGTGSAGTEAAGPGAGPPGERTDSRSPGDARPGGARE